MQYRVLYRAAPAWEVGANTPQVIKGSHYPDDYAGKVISVKPLDHTFTPADLAGDRALVELDLTDAKVADLRLRQLKLTAGLPSPVTFDDRWGQLAVGLRARWGDDAEVKEALAISRAEADLVLETGPGDEEFDQEVRRLKAALPSMVVHTGAGLYEVGPGKTYSTVQAAFDQLWTDQGATTFTASQYIRCFAATYAENVTPNASLTPDVTNGYLLILEGDPADSRDNILIYPTTGAAITFADFQLFTRHLSLQGNSGATVYYGGSNSRHQHIDDCKITAGTGIAVRITFSMLIENSEILCTGDAMALYSGYTGFHVRRCKITGPGKASSTKTAITVDAYYSWGQTVIEGTVVSGFTNGIAVADAYHGTCRIANCTFYDCTTAVKLFAVTNRIWDVTNCIFENCTYNYQVTAWPEETSTQIGPVFTQRGNTYYGYTNFAYDGTTTKTYAQWTAFGQVDSANELDAVDPGLTDPGAGDFSLEGGTTSQHTGSGSGVPYDVDGDPFDPYHPDRGAKSTGIGPNVAFAGH